MDSLLSVYVTTKNNDSLRSVGNSYVGWNFKQNRLPSAIRVIDTILFHSQSDSLFEANIYFKKGFLLYKLNLYEDAIVAFKMAQDKGGSNYIGRTSSEIAKSYFSLGDNESSILYFKLAYAYYKEKGDKMRVIKNTINSVNAYLAFNANSRLDELERRLQEADSLVSLVEVTPQIALEVKRALGSYYAQHSVFNIERALDYNEQSLVISERLRDSLSSAEIRSSQGRLYTEVDFKRSLDFYKQALKLAGNSKEIRSLIYSNRGYTLARNNFFDESLEDQFRALQLVTETDFKNGDPKLLRSVIEKESKNQNLWIALANVAETYAKRYEYGNDKDHLLKSLRYFKYADVLFDVYGKNTENRNTKLHWREKASSLYSRALSICYLLEDYEKAFYFMEKNKSLLLNEELTKRNLYKKFNINRAQIAKEKFYSLQISNIERKPNNLKNQFSIIQYVDSIHKIKRDYYKVQKDESFLQIAIVEPITLNDVQGQLKEGELVLEYHLYPDNAYGIYSNHNVGYVIAITNEKVDLYPIKNIKKLKAEIIEATALLKKPSTTIKQNKYYHQLSHRIFKSLIPDKLGNTMTSYVIIPDDFLSFLPFESLISSINNTRYLLEDVNISYTHSLTFQHSITSVVRDQFTNAVGFAPISFGYDQLSTLEFTRNELDFVKDVFTMNVFKENDASIENFLSQLPKANVIHLATHASASQDNPWIAFNNSKLSLDELYLTENVADLVVLSACDTSLGTLETGEGVMSLSRGFFYAGAKSTVSSLWSVDDKSTQLILASFYKYMALGKSKAGALQQAKIDYLNDHNGSEKSPYYWSALILTGTNNVIDIPSTSHVLIWVLLLIFLITCGILYFWKTRKID